MIPSSYIILAPLLKFILISNRALQEKIFGNLQMSQYKREGIFLSVSWPFYFCVPESILTFFVANPARSWNSRREDFPQNLCPLLLSFHLDPPHKVLLRSYPKSTLIIMRFTSILAVSLTLFLAQTVAAVPSSPLTHTLYPRGSCSGGVSVCCGSASVGCSGNVCKACCSGTCGCFYTRGSTCSSDPSVTPCVDVWVIIWFI